MRDGSPLVKALMRQLELLKNKKVLVAGFLEDDLRFLTDEVKELNIWSWYFDYARHHQEVLFQETCQTPSDVMVFFWSKNKLENQFQLLQWLATAPCHQEVFIVGENRSGVKAVEKILSPFGNIAKIDSARRCSVYHFELLENPIFNLQDYWKHFELDSGLKIMNLPGVFSANTLDSGTELLLSTLNNRPFFGEVLDLGCGAGVIGSTVKKLHPHTDVTMTDIHAMALKSTRQTLKENGLTGKVLASDVFSHIEGKFDVILSNPPFHSGVDTAYRAVTELIQQAKWHLKPGGELRLVANRHLPYPELLDRYFGSHQRLAETTKFCVYSVQN